jgi:cytochrome c-type biogenesis protein CcmE
MTPRQRRMALVGVAVLGVAGAVALALQAFEENMTYFVTPTELLADAKRADKSFRLGGMVKEGSVQRTPGNLEVRFTVTDMKQEMPVSYNGVLPDLFREGQGVITRGKFVNGVFNADEVLAKHDEKYMPPEVAKKLAEQHANTAAPTP